MSPCAKRRGGLQCVPTPTNYEQFKAVVTALVWGHCNIMATQTTITKAQENKGAKGILDLTSQLSQVLKQFEGLYTKPLPECNGLTVEQWMGAHGVKRFEKNGKKKGYTPALLMDGWHEGMKNVDAKGTRAFVYKNVPAKYQPCTEDIERWGLKDFETAFRVFTKEEAEKVDGKPISRYMLTPIADNKWSVATIIKGLKQKNNFEKENEKNVLSDLDWENTEHVYIVRFDKNNDGNIVRRIIEVNKESVNF